MSIASHWLRYSLFALILAAVAFGAILTHSASPVSAVGPEDIYVGANGTPGASPAGLPCTAPPLSHSYTRCFDTITGAIGGSTPDSHIAVDDGTYNENPNISVTGLTVVSLNGAPTTTIQFGSGYVVGISADDTTFGEPGGVSGHGFTVVQSGSGILTAAVSIAGYGVIGDSVVIQNNDYVGAESGYGVYVNPPMEGGHLTIQNNTFSTVPTNDYSFLNLIYFGAAPYPAPISANLAALSADIDIIDNTGVDFGLDAINFDGSLFFSTVNIDGNTFTDAAIPAGSTTGIYVNGDVRTFSSVSVTDTEIDDADYGLDVTGDLTNHSSLTLSNFTADQFTLIGVAIEGSISNQSALSIVDSTLTGDGGAATGIYIGSTIESGSMFIVSDTTISGFVANGIYVGDTLQNGSTMLVQDSTINGASGGAANGIYLNQGVQAATLTIDPTTITNFTTAGIYVQDQAQGSTVQIDENILIAHEDGAEYCFEFGNAPNQGSYGAISYNTCTGFGGPNATVGGGYGVYADEGMYFHSTWLIDHNTFTSHADGASEGFHLRYVTTDSHLTVTDNEASHLTSLGIQMSGVEQNSSAHLDRNTLTALTGGGADDGMNLQDVETNSDATANDNIITGFDSSGITYSDVINSSTVDISRNSITAAQDGAEYGIHTDYIDYGSHVTVNDNNPVTGFGGPNSGTGYGFYTGYVEDSSSLGLDGNTFTAHADGAYYGIEISSGTLYSSETTMTNNTVNGWTYAGLDPYDVGYDSHVTVTGNTVIARGTGGGTYGINFSSVYYGSTAVVNDNNVFGFNDTGLYLYDIYDNTTLSADHNTFTSDAAGARYGFYVSDLFEHGASVNLTHNQFSGYNYAGIYVSPTIDTGSQLLASDNVFAALDCTPDAVPTLPFTTPYGCLVGPYGSEYGIYMDYAEYGSTVDIQRNVFTGFGGTGMSSGYGMYVSYAAVDDGGTFKLIGNKFYGAQGNGADAPDYGFYVGSYLIYAGGDAWIQNNTVTEFDYAGLALYDVDNGNATVTGNTLTADAFGSEYGISMDYVIDGSNVAVNNNTATNIGTPNASTGYGLYMYDIEDANATYDGNTFSSTPDGMSYCAYVDDSIDSGANLNFTNNHCSGYTDYGFYVSPDITNGSVLHADGNTFNGDTATGAYLPSAYSGSSVYGNGNTVTGTNDAGIHAGYMTEGGVLQLNDNHITGDAVAGGVPDGITIPAGVENGSTLEINRNTINNVSNSGEGIYNYEVWDHSTGTICNNNISGVPGGLDTGLELEYLSGGGSSLNICNNTVTGFTDTGFHASSGSDDGGHNTISGNGLTADPSGANYGMNIGSLTDGTVTDIESNSITGVDGDAGIQVTETTTGSETTVHNNVLHLDDADWGVAVFNGSVGDGSTFDVTQNEITGYDVDGVFFYNELWGSKATVQNNILIGSGTHAGIAFGSVISFGSIVNILNNCITHSDESIEIDNLQSAAQLHIHQNDLSGPAIAILVLPPDTAPLIVDAENNWYGSATGPSGVGPGTGRSIGGATVDFDPWLTGGPPPCSGATATPTPTATIVPTVFCGTGTATSTGSASPTATPSPTPTPGGPITARPTRTPGITATPVPSVTATGTGGPTNTATATPTASPTPTDSCAPTSAPTGTGTGTATATASPSPSPTPSPSPSPSPTPPGGVTPRPTRTPAL